MRMHQFITHVHRDLANVYPHQAPAEYPTHSYTFDGRGPRGAIWESSDKDGANKNMGSSQVA